jgi:hypothetical protein
VSVSPGSLQLTRQWHSYGGWLTLSNPTGTALAWSISLPHGLAVANGRTSGTLAPHSTGPAATRLYIIATGGGGWQGNGSDQGQSTTKTVTVQPGNVPVQVTIPLTPRGDAPTRRPWH